jgi:hypothetical protein
MSDFWQGIIGVVVGSGTMLLVNWCQHKWQTSEQRKLDEKRKAMLSTMLMSGDHNWRKLETLSRVIGADYATTTRLLIELGARGSESEREVWALQSRKPLA